MSSVTETPIAHTEPVNAKILAISEDQIKGFVRDPFGEIAAKSGVDVETVMERIRAMLRAGTIRRVRQTLMATNLAEGALVAWQYPPDKLEAAFDYMFQKDPFSGHVVTRSTDAATPGSNYRLWTTVKVPQGYSVAKHCAVLARLTGAEHFRVMPAKRIFALGVGHVRRMGMEPGSKSEELAEVKDTTKVELTDLEWRVLTALKRELAPEEIRRDVWQQRAAEAGGPLEQFYEVAESLNARKGIGRFSTFLEHLKAPQTRARRARDALQRALSLGRAAGTRDGRGTPGRTLPHPHALLLARGRPGVPQREHHGGGARDGEGSRARAQEGDRRASGGGGHPGLVHERVLGRPQRDQAVGDLAVRVSGVVRDGGRGSRFD